MSARPLIVHVGYPKTATTTFQKNVFPHHPDIEYLGKFIPSYDFADPTLKRELDSLLFSDRLNYPGTGNLRQTVDSLRAKTSRKCALISTESFIHPSAVDLATVADRVFDAFAPCKILITIREQISSILSFYWMHGRFGQYLALGPKDEADRIEYPIRFREWLRFQQSSPYRNYMATLHYDRVVAYYALKFGPENVRVLIYESLKEDPDAYADDLSGFLGVDPATTRRLAAGKHEYPAEKRNMPWAKAHINDLIDFSDGCGCLSAFMRLMGLRKDCRAIASPEALLNDLAEAYRAGNRRLENDLKLPLSRYGYSV